MTLYIERDYGRDARLFIAYYEARFNYKRAIIWSPLYLNFHCVKF